MKFAARCCHRGAADTVAATLLISYSYSDSYSSSFFSK